MINDIAKVFIPMALAFGSGIAITPLITHFLYSRKMWKKKAGKIAYDGKEASVFNDLHKDKEVGTPRMGGSVIWLSSLITIIGLWTVGILLPGDITEKLNFFSRNQTWVPLVALIVGALVGLVDDMLDIYGSKDHMAGGLSLKKRLLIVALISLGCAVWFYFKLDASTIGIPFGERLEIGAWFIPLFVLVTLAIYSGGVIDGLDGLAGGIFAVIFSAYAGIAFAQNQIDLAAFSAMLVGAILAFLWFNIPPARFYMSETGSMALTLALSVVAFMTDSLGKGHGIVVLPIIALPLVLTTLSVIIQLLSKKFRGKKIFRVAPLHHHFEALGWPSYKVTMRYWVLSVFFAIIGLIVALIS